MSDSNYNILVEKLNQFIRKYYKNLLLRGLIYSTGLLLLFFISVTFLEYLAHFNSTIRTILFYAFLFASSFVIVKYIVAPFLGLYQLRKTLSYEQAATIIGNHFSSVQDKLLNVLQLHKLSNSNDTRLLHADLLTASIDQKILELKPIPFTSAVNLAENKKYLKYALVPISLLIVILFTAPSLITDGTKRLVAHNQFFEKEAPFQFVITNADLKTVAQHDFELKIKLTGDEIPENAYIDIDGNEFKLSKENVVNFSYLFKNVQKNIPFQLTADGFKSKEYELVALPNPILLSFDITLNYPAYLNKKDELIKNTGDLVIPAGTKVSWNFNTQNTEDLILNFGDTAFHVNPSSKDKFSYTHRLFKDKTYAVKTANHFLKSTDSVSYLINVIPDTYPSIDILEKKDSLSTRRFFFSGEVKDDHGFNKLTFNYRFIINNDSAITDNTIKLTTNSTPININKNATQDRFLHAWDFSSLSISPGDQIEYYFEVWDNDGVTGSKSTRSQKKIFKAPTLKEIAETTDKNNDKIKDALEESIEATKNVQKELADLQRKIAEKKELTWEEKKKLEDLLKKQKELQNKVEQIKNENEQNNKQQNEFKQPNEEMLDKQKKLEDLFDKVMTPELKQKYEELQKLLQQLDKDKVQEALEKMKLDNKDLMKELDRNLEIFKQLELEQKIQQNIEKLDELSKKEEDLSKKSEDKSSDAKEQKDKQDELNKEFQDLKKDLQEMEEKNKELEKPMKMENTEQKQEEINKEMQKSSEQLNNNQKKNASKSQKNAAQKMQEMSKELAQMQEKEQQEQEGEDINKLRDILENLIQLSFGQEAVMTDLSKTKANNPQYVKLNQRQKKLQDDSKMIEDSLLALSKRVPQIQATVNHEISAINMNMEKAGDEIKESQTISMDGRNHQQEALSRQQMAMTSINNLALMLNEALQQMQDAAKKQGPPGSGSCKKPGGSSNKPSMANMRQMQEQLNKQIQKLKEGMEKNGNKPGQKPGSLGQGMSQELAKLAAQQEAIRKEVQKMADQINKDGKGGGNIGKLAEKMEETETDLVNKMLSQETVKRQQEILTKMLESEKAEKEREMDEQRQSNEAKNEIYSNPNAFLEYNLLKQKETELLKTVPPSLNPFFKIKVNQYFNTFEK
ncbi:MAG TPA: hypothetical protein PK289_01285 [Bacteroidia bacterium]|nr:hypothetical protein [Bacteroidia bacterium]HRG52578.1 hypothetical protein [Bacteroidia bacterium]